MKAVILAGGLGSRLAEETTTRPKPMVEIGDRPILWHIMSTYAAHGIKDFVVCLGYKGYVVKEYFANYLLHRSNITFDLRGNTMQIHDGEVEDWTVTLIETGASTMTGGRLRRALPFVEDDDDFCMTYGDGVADIDLGHLIDHHRAEGRLATMTAVQAPARFGSVHVEGTRVTHFSEKTPVDGALINGGFFVLSPEIGRYLHGDDDVWEQEPLEQLTADGQLTCYEHKGFWHPMDTVRDRRYLEELWASGAAPWTAHW